MNKGEIIKQLEEAKENVNISLEDSTNKIMSQIVVATSDIDTNNMLKAKANLSKVLSALKGDK